MKRIVAGGFAALILTIIGCTYVIKDAIRRYNFDGGDIVSAINREGQLTRDAIRGKPEPAPPSIGWPWPEQ